MSKAMDPRVTGVDARALIAIDREPP